MLKVVREGKINPSYFLPNKYTKSINPEFLSFLRKGQKLAPHSYPKHLDPRTGQPIYMLYK